MNGFRRFLTFIVLLHFSGIFSGCIPRPVENIPAPDIPNIQELTSLPSPTLPSLQISNFENNLAATPTAMVLPDHDSTPLQLVFPTPGPDPISLWRAPLNSIPWALGSFDHFYFLRPIAADEINWPLPDYRYGGIFFSTDIVHTGVDIPAPRGTTILAAANGQVVWAGYGLYSGSGSPNDPYGLAVTIAHEFGYQGRKLYTVYAHMDRIDVITGQQIQAGDPLGIVGTTGKTTGPHLHFEVRIEDNSFYATRNPELWLAPPQGTGVLVGQLRNTNRSFLTEQAVRVKSLSTGERWEVISYGKTTVNQDEYYKENLVLSDLPAGEYEIHIDYLDNLYTCEVTIHPGAVTYFTFQGEAGYHFDLPLVPGLDSWESSMRLIP